MGTSQKEKARNCEWKEMNTLREGNIVIYKQQEAVRVLDVLDEFPDIVPVMRANGFFEIVHRIHLEDYSLPDDTHRSLINEYLKSEGKQLENLSPFDAIKVVVGKYK